jgi:hypothetical protein
MVTERRAGLNAGNAGARIGQAPTPARIAEIALDKLL